MSCSNIDSRRDDVGTAKFRADFDRGDGKIWRALSRTPEMNGDCSGPNGTIALFSETAEDHEHVVLLSVYPWLPSCGVTAALGEASVILMSLFSGGESLEHAAEPRSAPRHTRGPIATLLLVHTGRDSVSHEQHRHVCFASLKERSKDLVGYLSFSCSCLPFHQQDLSQCIGRLFSACSQAALSPATHVLSLLEMSSMSGTFVECSQMHRMPAMDQRRP